MAELFTLLGTIKIDYTEAESAINNIKTKVESLASFISTDKLARGTLKIDSSEALAAIEAVKMAAQNMATYLGTNSAASGNVRVSNSTALSIINTVGTEAEKLANLINNGASTLGTLRIDNTSALAAINAVDAAAQTATNKLNSGVSGYLSAGGTTSSGSTSGSSSSDWILGSNLLTGGSGGTVWSNLWATIGETAKKGMSWLDVAAGNLLASGVRKATSSLMSVFQTGYEYNTFKETEIAKFATLLQTDKEDAAAFFDEIEQFAIDTPLSLEQVASSATKLLGAGVERHAIIDTLQMLGDLALGDTTTMTRLAKAYTDVDANGFLLAQEGRQVTETGIPIWDLLEQYYAATDGEYAGYSAGELKAMNKKDNPIPEDAFFGAFKMAVSPGGMFYDALTTVMDTTEGKAEQMQDKYRRTAGAVTEMMTAVFTSDTIPAMNELLDKLSKWAEENPDTLYNLAEAFSNLASISLTTFTESLTELIDWWGKHRTEFDSLLVMLGAFAFPSHPAVGTALMTMGGLDLYNATENSMDEEIRTSAEDGTFSFASALMPNDIEAQIVAGASREDLTEAEQDQYDKAVWWKTLMNLVDETWARYAVWDDWENAQKEVAPAWPHTQTEQDENGGGGRRFGLPEGVDADGLGGSLKQLDENMHDRSMLFASTNGVPDRGRGFESPTASIEEANANFSTLAATLAALQGLLSSLPAQIESAASNGVATGVSGITVTGTITTGNVVLNTGALVGQLTPKLNLSLGTASKYAHRTV